MKSPVFLLGREKRRRSATLRFERRLERRAAEAAEEFVLPRSVFRTGGLEVECAGRRFDRFLFHFE